jgi:hypothetical protein
MSVAEVTSAWHGSQDVTMRADSEISLLGEIFRSACRLCPRHFCVRVPADVVATL